MISSPMGNPGRGCSGRRGRSVVAQVGPDTLADSLRVTHKITSFSDDPAASTLRNISPDSSVDLELLPLPLRSVLGKENDYDGRVSDPFVHERDDIVAKTDIAYVDLGFMPTHGVVVLVLSLHPHRRWHVRRRSSRSWPTPKCSAVIITRSRFTEPRLRRRCDLNLRRSRRACMLPGSTGR